MSENGSDPGDEDTKLVPPWSIEGVMLPARTTALLRKIQAVAEEKFQTSAIVGIVGNDTVRIVPGAGGTEFRALTVSLYDEHDNPASEAVIMARVASVLAGDTTHYPARGAQHTTNGQAPAPGYENAPAPQPVGPNGQHGAYWVLSEAERKGGFVRPVRHAYKHVGTPGPKHPLRDLDNEERVRFADTGFVKFEQYPAGSRTVGRYWTQADLDKVDKGCGGVTSMGNALAETYAKQPGYYGATFCTTCRTHLPVGDRGEFVWLDRHGRVTDERVGT